MATEIATLIDEVNDVLQGALAAVGSLEAVSVIGYEPTHVYSPTVYTQLRNVTYERTAGYLGRRAFLRSRLVLYWQANEAADNAMYEYLTAIEGAFDASDLSGAIAGKVVLESVEPGFLPVSGGKFR